MLPGWAALSLSSGEAEGCTEDPEPRRGLGRRVEDPSEGGQEEHQEDEEVREAQAASSQLYLHRVGAVVGALRL